MPADVIIEGSLLPALVVAFAAGALSFFSPCVLPLVPGYLAYVGGSTETIPPESSLGNPRTRLSLPSEQLRLLLGVLLFILGFSAVFVVFFTVSAALGIWLITYEQIITRVLGVVIIVLGLVFSGFLKPLQYSRKMRVKPVAGLLGAPVLGAAFAVSWTPCIGPTLSLILALSLQEGSSLRGAILGGAYCAGLGLPFLLAAGGFGFMARTTGWVKRHMRAVNLLSGAVLVLIGVLMVTGLWSQLMSATQVWITGFAPAI